MEKVDLAIRIATGSWACIRKRLVYDVEIMNKWVEPSESSEAERVEEYGYVLERKKESMSKESAKPCHGREETGDRLSTRRT
jgi:hypothetical protein